MTELLDRAFSRTAFLKGGGALVVTFSMTGTAQAANGNTPFAQRGPQDYLSDLETIDAWITLNTDNTVTVTHGETELGHGTPTGILMIVADEMGMNMSQMRYAPPESWLNATGGGSGSGGIRRRTPPARAAAAAAKNALFGLASKQLGVPVASLTVRDGVVYGGGRSVKYGDLLGGRLFNVKMPSKEASLDFGEAPAKPVKDYTIVGTSPPRIDIPDKVIGNYTYVHNVKVPGMVHARIVRPRGAGGNASVNNQPASIDSRSIRHIPGVQIVRLNNFLAVVAPREYDAIQAAAQLDVKWKSDPKLPGSGNFWKWLREVGDSPAGMARYTAKTGNVDAALAAAAKKISATYMYQYNAHVPIGPQCAVADVRMDLNRATVFCSVQSLNGVAEDISEVIGLEPRNIRIVFYEGSSSYGTGQLVDTYLAAAAVSKAVGKPVRMQWMRWDQQGWDEFGPAALWDVRAGVDTKGRLVATDWTSYGQGRTRLKTTSELLGTDTWPKEGTLGGPRPSDGVYEPTTTRVLAKTQPLYGGAFKSSPLRAPNAPQSYFASEQMIDELAHAAGIDPIQIRRENIDGKTVDGARWLAVLDAATMAAGWRPKVAASSAGSGNVVSGRGFAFGTFAGSQIGMVADVEVNKKTGRVVAKHLYIAQNNGITAGPQLVGNQMSGAAIQGLSRAMYEQLTFTRERITSQDWVTYPILRFKESPRVTLVNVHPGKYTTVVPGDATTDVREGNTRAAEQGWAASGSGEPPTAAVAAAVANAFFDATGVRLRHAPMTPAHVRAALRQAGM
jgi:CO/xanthine dehydrogenase Mo-binding subunit